MKHEKKQGESLATMHTKNTRIHFAASREGQITNNSLGKNQPGSHPTAGVGWPQINAVSSGGGGGGHKTKCIECVLM